MSITVDQARDFATSVALDGGAAPAATFAAAKDGGSNAGFPSEGMSSGQTGMFVDNGSLVSFVASVSEQKRKDVLDSLLFAQLAASAQFKRNDKQDKWYDAYTDVLSKLGWVLTSFNFTKVKTSKKTFKVDDSILEILLALATGDGDAVLTATLDSLRKLANKNDGKIPIFDSAATDSKAASFQVSVASSSGDTVALALGGYYLTSSDRLVKVLWAEVESSKTEMLRGAQSVILNDAIYAGVRDIVAQRLSSSRGSNLLSIPLAK